MQVEKDEEKNAESLVKQFCTDLRKIQQRNKCTNALCSDVVLTLGKYLNITPKNFRKYDKILQQEAGIRFLRLNGCTTCNKFVFLPEDRRRLCPLCQGPRFDANNKALEVFRLLSVSVIIFVIIKLLFAFVCLFFSKLNGVCLHREFCTSLCENALKSFCAVKNIARCVNTNIFDLATKTS